MLHKRPPKSHRGYMKSVISHLIIMKHIDEKQATRLLLKHYRVIYRSWSHELNTEHFAEKVFWLEEILQEALASSSSDDEKGYIRWTRSDLKLLTVYMDKKLYRKAKSFALLHNKELATVIEMALENFFEQNERKNDSRSET